MNHPGNMNTCMFCTMCCYNTTIPKEMNNHISRWHKNDPNFTVSCPFKGCEYSTNSWNAYRIHSSRTTHHNDEVDKSNHPVTGVCTQESNNISMDTAVVPLHSEYTADDDMSRKIHSEIQYVLSLQAHCNLSNTTTDKVLEITKDFVMETVTQTLKKAKTALEKSNVDPVLLDEIGLEYDPPFETLRSQYLREATYVKKCGLLNAQEVLLGKKSVSVGRKTKRLKRFGYIVPLKDLLERLLSLPEIWQWVNSPRLNDTNSNVIMADISDGEYLQQHELFVKHQSALQIILYNDDIELVNPIGAHTKKHKLSMFYMTLGNIPPQFRSKLHSIFLLAVAKVQDVKQFGLVNLLTDFISTVSVLATTGLDLEISGISKRVYGNVVMIPADTPAANFLGGFKESVSFAYKGCRKCNATATDMKENFRHRDFIIRDFPTHLDRCDMLASVSKEAKIYWSKFWGINKKSCLCGIPNSPITETLVQDPMHILMEGLVPMEMRQFLSYAINEKKYFTLGHLNSKLLGFPYTYLEQDKPEIMTREDILPTGTKIKQTSAAILALCATLPLMLGDKIPTEDERWQNFLRLLKITHIVTSPYTTLNTIGQLEQIIATHHTCFQHHYPNASFVPKMHYLVHIPNQMKLFGPGRQQWCLRFEAKHGYFKGLSNRCFKNILKTVCKKHQLYMCSKQYAYSGESSPNFFYSGDKVGKGVSVNCKEVFGYIEDRLISAFPTRNWEENEGIYRCASVEIHGFKYRQGCYILLEQEENDLPVFGLIRDVVVVDCEKGFIVDKLETVGYDPNILSYVVHKTSLQDVIPFSSLKNPWPRSGHLFDNQMCIVNNLSHSFEF